MNTLETYQNELNKTIQSLNESYRRAGFDPGKMNEIEEGLIPKDLKERKRRILETMEGLRRKIAVLKSVNKRQAA
ncbi:MAG: hypothetical protein H7A25_00630 [Leptospiraceae bacterium]|nr:hypothetical protein [Leptospiraceae bacterium]MCP5498382.1 hypothetical protein [Leptospiraceae bacterium]